MKIKKAIEKVYEQYGVKIRLKLINTKISCCQYYLVEILPGTKVGDIFKHAQNVQMVLKIPTLIPFINNTYIVLLASAMEAMPNNYLNLYRSEHFHCNDYRLPIAIGYDLFFRPVVRDMAEMIHILCAGVTNSGKSTFLICLVLSLIMKCTVRMVNLLIFDIGATSLSDFEGIPHLSHPIIKDEKTGLYVLNSLVNEMEQRIQLSPDELLEKPAVVCVIDEFTSLMSNLSDKKMADEYKKILDNLLRRGRKAKIHLVLATQNPSSDEMKIDKGNATTRIAFKLSSQQTSHSFIGDTGAEGLPGKGAMLFRDYSSISPIRIQGAYISSEDALSLISDIKESEQDVSTAFRIPVCNYSESVLNEAVNHIEHQPIADDREFATIALWCLGNRSVSSLKIQKAFKIGNRANIFIERLAKINLISGKSANLPRKVLPGSLEDLSEEARLFFKANYVEDEEIMKAISNRI